MVIIDEIKYNDGGRTKNITVWVTFGGEHINVKTGGYIRVHGGENEKWMDESHSHLAKAITELAKAIEALPVEN